LKLCQESKNGCLTVEGPGGRQRKETEKEEELSPEFFRGKTGRGGRSDVHSTSQKGKTKKGKRNRCSLDGKGKKGLA